MQENFLFHGQNLNFMVSPGVFAQYGLDYGSKYLLETITLPKSGLVLDLGCGCGVIGLSIASTCPDLHVYLVDSDIRSIRLTKQNAELNGITNVTILLSDVISDLPPQTKFSLVISNPPTHQGSEVVYQFIRGAKTCLQNLGEAYFVVNRLTSVMNKLELEFGNAQKIGRRQGYIVFKAIKNE